MMIALFKIPLRAFLSVDSSLRNLIALARLVIAISLTKDCLEIQVFGAFSYKTKNYNRQFKLSFLQQTKS